MLEKKFNPQFPVVLGICGEAGTGKTTLADKLAPIARIGQPIIGEEEETDPVVWDHIYFAAPLYEMASVKNDISGVSRRDRVLFELHGILYELFGSSPLYGVPPYDEFVKIVHDVYDMPIEPTGKPRTFLQILGQYCRSVNPDVFVKYCERKIRRTTNDEAISVVVVSDVRQGNEAKMITDQKNGILIRLTASDETRIERLVTRDDRKPTVDQLQRDNDQLSTVSEGIYDFVIDTDALSEVEVYQQVKKIVEDYIKE